MASPAALWPPTFKAAIFDFDGTLAATEDIWREVDEAFFFSRGLSYDEFAHQTLATLGFRGGAEWCIATYGLDEDADAICDEWNRMGRALYETRVTLRPGAADYLRALREKGIPLALATTNDPQVLASMAPRIDVAELFDAVVCGKEVARPKDHPDIYLEAARRIGAEPADCMVFEDILAGTKSAQSVGMSVCALRSTDARQPWAELRETAELAIEGWESVLLA